MRPDHDGEVTASFMDSMARRNCTRLISAVHAASSSGMAGVQTS